MNAVPLHDKPNQKDIYYDISSISIYTNQIQIFW